MRETSWNERALRAAGVAVITLGLAGPLAGDELTDVSPLTTPDSSRGPSDRPAAALDAESPETSASEAKTESPSLPTPADDVVLPPSGDGFLDAVVEYHIITEYGGISLAPRPLRRSRRLP